MKQGREVWIVEAVRTPIGRGHAKKGHFRDLHAVDLLARAYTGVIERSGLDAAQVEDVLAGCVLQAGEQGYNVARNAWLHAGYPVEAAAVTVDRQCGSAQAAVNLGAALVAAGVHDVVMGAGVEHMGHLSFAVGAEIQDRYGSANTPELLAHHPIINQGIGAELIAEEYGISRTAMEELAVLSHARAAAATASGAFAREILPVAVGDQSIRVDQGIRADSNLETLSTLKPAFKENGRITAATSSQISDGAAAVLLMTADKADALGLRPRARIVDQVTVGCDPVKMLEGPIPATSAILKRNGMAISDVDRFEVNEAFASVVAAWRDAHGVDMDRVNVRGGAMALGHPLGATGARLITTLLHILEDEDLETGLVTMCCGGGLGTGTLIQRV